MKKKQKKTKKTWYAAANTITNRQMFKLLLAKLLLMKCQSTYNPKACCYVTSQMAWFVILSLVALNKVILKLKQ